MSPGLTALTFFLAETDAGSMEAASPERPSPEHRQLRAASHRIHLHGESPGPGLPHISQTRLEVWFPGSVIHQLRPSLSHKFLICKRETRSPTWWAFTKVNQDYVCGPDP